MYSEKDTALLWASLHISRAASMPVPFHKLFYICVTRKRTKPRTYKRARGGTLPQIPTHTECPSSPCSEMNELAAVLNHFNHFSGKCLIHSYHFALPCSYLMYTHFYASLKHQPSHGRALTHTHKHNDCHSLIAMCNRALQNLSYSLSLTTDNKMPNDITGTPQLLLINPLNRHAYSHSHILNCVKVLCGQIKSIL